jgi:hypothetical protein
VCKAGDGKSVTLADAGIDSFQPSMCSMASDQGLSRTVSTLAKEDTPLPLWTSCRLLMALGI